MQKCRKGFTWATNIAYNIIKVSSSSCVLAFKRPSTSGILETVRVLKEITNLLPLVISAFNKYRPRYIVNLCFVFMWNKKFLIEWIFFKLASPAFSYSVTSNPPPRFSHMLSFNEDSKYLSNTTRISKAFPASHNTILRKASANWWQFYTACPNLILFTTAIPFNITVAFEMACCSCDAVACFISYSLPCITSAFFDSKDNLPLLVNREICIGLWTF